MPAHKRKTRSAARFQGQAGGELGPRGRKSGGNVVPSMNVTPLIDIVLVLLIVFMVITPMLAKQFYVHLPKQDKDKVETPPDPGSQPLVLSLTADGIVKLNDTEVPLSELVMKLRRVFAARDDHMLFFDAHEDAPYGLAVQLLDKARDGGAVTISILTERPEGAE